MQPIYKAVVEFLYSMFVKKKEIPKEIPPIPKKQIPVGYKAFYFKCWLCTGRNEFACEKFTQEKNFTIECSWCGIENTVTVFTPKS